MSVIRSVISLFPAARTCAKGSLAFLEVEDEELIFWRGALSVFVVVVGDGVVVPNTVIFPVVVVFMRGRRCASAR